MEKQQSVPQEWVEMKRKHPDAVLLMRNGDFYEVFGEDAATASEILGITLTRRTDGTKIAGFPHHALDTYLPKLVHAGKRVAICESLQDPKHKKNVGKNADEEGAENLRKARGKTTGEPVPPPQVEAQEKEKSTKEQNKAEKNQSEESKFRLNVGDEVFYDRYGTGKWEKYKVTDFHYDGRPVLDSFGVSFLTEIADWNLLRPVLGQEQAVDSSNEEMKNVAAASVKKPEEVFYTEIVSIQDYETVSRLDALADGINGDKEVLEYLKGYDNGDAIDLSQTFRTVKNLHDTKLGEDDNYIVFSNFYDDSYRLFAKSTPAQILAMAERFGVEATSEDVKALYAEAGKAKAVIQGKQTSDKDKSDKVVEAVGETTQKGKSREGGSEHKQKKIKKQKGMKEDDKEVKTRAKEAFKNSMEKFHRVNISYIFDRMAPWPQQRVAQLEREGWNGPFEGTLISDMGLSGLMKYNPLLSHSRVYENFEDNKTFYSGNLAKKVEGIEKWIRKREGELGDDAEMDAWIDRAKDSVKKLNDQISKNLQKKTDNPQQQQKASDSEKKVEKTFVPQKEITNVDGDTITLENVYRRGKEAILYCRRQDAERNWSIGLKSVVISEADFKGYFEGTTSAYRLVEKYKPAQLQPKMDKRQFYDMPKTMSNGTTAGMFHLREVKDELGRRVTFMDATVNGERMSKVCPTEIMEEYWKRSRPCSALFASVYGEDLRLKEHYDGQQLPPQSKGFRFKLDNSDGACQIVANHGTYGKFASPITAVDYKAVKEGIATEKQLAAKYLGWEMKWAVIERNERDLGQDQQKGMKR